MSAVHLSADATWGIKRVVLVPSYACVVPEFVQVEREAEDTSDAPASDAGQAVISTDGHFANVMLTAVDGP